MAVSWPVVGHDDTVHLNGATIWGSYGGDREGSEDAAQQECRAAYTASNLQIYLWGVSGPDPTLAIWINGALGNQTLTPTSLGEHEDLVNTDSLSVGDLISTRFDHSSGMHGDSVQVTIHQTHLAESGENSNPPWWGSGDLTTSSGGGTEWLPIMGAAVGPLTEAQAETTMRTARTLSDFRIWVITHGNDDPTYVVRKNGADGNITVTPTTTGAISDLVNSDSFSVGDEANIEVVPVGNIVTSTIHSLLSDGFQTLQNGAADDQVAIDIYFRPSTAIMDGTQASCFTEYEDEQPVIQNFFMHVLTFAEERNYNTINVASTVIATITPTTTGVFENLVDADVISQRFVFSRDSGGITGNNELRLMAEWDLTPAGEKLPAPIRRIAGTLISHPAPQYTW